MKVLDITKTKSNSPFPSSLFHISSVSEMVTPLFQMLSLKQNKQNRVFLIVHMINQHCIAHYYSILPTTISEFMPFLEENS